MPAPRPPAGASDGEIVRADRAAKAAFNAKTRLLARVRARRG